jgi:iron complex transport system substrate-binding protein
VIVVADDGPGIPDSEAFASTFAVRNDQVVTVDGNYISQPAPRIALALEEVATALETAETADSAGATDGETDDAPGFGVGVALLALASGALLAGRRR